MPSDADRPAPAPLSAAARSTIEALPTALRALLDRELAAGNRIARVGGGHPAPPIGAAIMLTGQLSSAELPEGLEAIARNSSLYSLEISDADQRYFILTPPIPPADLPSMDEIRAAHAGRPFPETRPSIDEVLFGRLELDIRGETLLFYKGAWRATIDWTWNRGHRIYRSSLSDWFDTVARKTIPMTPADRDNVVRQIHELARRELGSEVELCD
jgi:hypothetical protein